MGADRRASTLHALTVLAAIGVALGAAGCDDPCFDATYDPCDVLEEGCQKAVYTAIACLREAKDATPPPIRVLTPDEYAAELRATATEAPDAPYDAAADRLLRFSPPDAGGTLEEWIAYRVRMTLAYYSNTTKQVTLIRHDDADPDEAQQVLAHEFVHAQQDLEHDLQALLTTYAVTVDSELGVRSLVEGEAMHQQGAYYAALQGWESVDYAAAYAEMQTNCRASAVNATTDIVEAVDGFAYAFGGAYVTLVWESSGAGAVNGLFGDPPRTSLDYFRGDPETRVPTVATLPDLGLALPEGYRQIRDTTLGAWALYAFFARTGLVADAEFLATGWDGDRREVFAAEAPESAVVLWRIRFTDAADATAAAAGIASSTAAGGVWQVRADDREVTLVAAATQAELDTFTALVGGF